MEKIKILLRKDKDTGAIYIVFPSKDNTLEYYNGKGYAQMTREYYYHNTLPYYQKEAVDFLREYASSQRMDLSCFDVIRKMNYQ